MKFRQPTGAAVALCIAIGSGRHGSRRAARLRRPRGAGQQDLDPAVDVRRYIGFGTDAATIERTADVFAALSEMGYRNVEPFTLSGLRRGSTAHCSTSTASRRRRATWTSARRRTPPTSTRSSRTTARSGSSTSARAPPPTSRRSTRPRRSGSPTPSTWTPSVSGLARRVRRSWSTTTTGSSRTIFGDTRRTRSCWRTPSEERRLPVRPVLGAYGGAPGIAVDLVERYGKRVQLFHVKDMAAGPFPGRIEIVGKGGIDFPALVAAAEAPVRLLRRRARPALRRPLLRPVRGRRRRGSSTSAV